MWNKLSGFRPGQLAYCERCSIEVEGEPCEECGGWYPDYVYDLFPDDQRRHGETTLYTTGPDNELVTLSHTPAGMDPPSTARLVNLRPLVLALLVVLLAAVACEESSDPTPCEELGELNSKCLGVDADDAAWLCQETLDGNEDAGDVEHTQCVIDCAPTTCDELDACWGDCLSE